MTAFEEKPAADVPPNIAAIQQAIVEEFDAFTDWEGKYRHLIHLGKLLPEMPPELKTEQNRVHGCQSQVWMHAELQAPNRVRYYADSDAFIVRGLISILLRLYSGQPAGVIVTTPPDIFDELDLGKHLSMQRSNGLGAMLKQMKLYAMALQMQAQLS